MRKLRNHKRTGRKARKLDTVGVRGSIPRGPTIKTRSLIEIPEGYSAIPAMSVRNGRFRGYRVLAKDPVKKCDKSVIRRRRAG